MEFNKLYNNDVLEILKNTPDSSLDMVYGDPDYNVGINYNGSKYTQKWDDYIAWYCELAKESMRVLKPSGNLFMLNVRGESMINIGIHDGDKVIVREASTAKNGDIVVALVDDSATVKTYYKEDGRYRLQPENDTMDPIYVDHVQILGIVIGLFRLY